MALGNSCRGAICRPTSPPFRTRVRSGITSPGPVPFSRTVMTVRVWSFLASVAGATTAYGCARAADALVLRVARPPRGEVLLVSDVILAAAFGIAVYMWLNLRATRKRLTSLERAQIVMDTQLSLAAQIQRHLLPPLSAGSNGVRWAGRLEPAYQIGGDFYDVISVQADDLFVIGDVSGKGIPAALLQASAHSLFHTLARETADPAELLTRVSKEIYAENTGALYLTCLLVNVHNATRTVAYANAGHPAGLVLGHSGRRLLSRGGPPAGLFPETVYESEVLSMEPGDLGVFVSDGITEAIEEDGVSAVDILNRTICEIPEPRTPEHVCDVLMQTAQRGIGPRGVANWQDDKTVLAFLFDGQSALRG
jgi:sigma-B regulation protein RsbU (phosphoserine phosphatase)